MEGYPADNITAALTAAEVGTALWPVTSSETSSGITPTNFGYEPGNILRYGAADGADSTTAFQNALDINHEIFIPVGTYLLTSTVTWNGVSTTIRGDGGFNSVLKWTGTANGTMMDTTANLRHMSKIEDVYFDANESADICLHVKKTARQMTLNRVLLTDAQEDAIRLGDFTNDAADADIANFLLNDCELLDNKHGIYWDSVNAVGISAKGTYFSAVRAGTVTSHLRMVRGGEIYTDDACFFGGYSSGGDDYAIYIKDGWGTIEDSGFEYGITPNNGGTLHLDTPALSSSGTNRQTVFSGNRVFSKGDNSAANHIKISSSNHPLALIQNNFSGKSVLSTYCINNAGGSQILSVFNNYEGRSWTSAHQATIQSIGDTYDDGTDFLPLGNIIGVQKTITSGDSPYTVRGEDTIRSNSGAVTINLPGAGSDHQTGGGRHRRITIIRTANGGVTTIDPNGAETVNGASTLAMSSGVEHAVTLESDGSSNWQIIGWYVENTVQAPSSGTGTVKMGSGSAADSAGWLETTPGKFIPYWTDVTP